MKTKIYVEYLDLKGGETELRPDPILLYTEKDVQRFERAQQAWSQYRGDRQKRLFERALNILEVYDKANKFDEINKKKTFWQKFKGLFRA